MKLFLDFETYYSAPYSLTKMTTTEYVRDEQFYIHGVGLKIENEPAFYVYDIDVEEALRTIWEEYEDIELVCHNARFDAYILAYHFGLHATRNIDTAAMAAGYFPGQTKSLKDVCIRLWPDEDRMRKGDELKSTKGIRNLSPELAQSLGGYCIQDINLTHAVYYAIAPKYPAREMELIHLHTTMFTKPLLELNTVAVHEYLEETRKLRAEKIEKSGYPAAQLRSNIKFAALIRELGLEPPMKMSVTTGKETYAFAKGDVGYQNFVNSNPKYNHIWEARASEKSTIDRTRAQRFLDAADPDTRKMSIPLNYYGAHTGRASGGDKLNFQNLKRGSTLRKALVAPEGYQVVVADSSNIEARVLAWLAEQDDIIEQYEDGKDVYCSFADKIFPELAPTNKKDHPFERFLGKVCILGLGFGMGWRKFQATLKAGALGNDPIDISDKKAKEIVDMYRDSNMQIAALWKTLDSHLFQMRNCHPDDKFPWSVCDIGYQYIGLPNGMRLTYPGLRRIASADAWRNSDLAVDDYAVFGDQELVSNNVIHPDTPDREFALHNQTRKTYGAKVVENLVQALARIIVMDQMLDINKVYPVVLTVHDEVICVVPDDQAQTALDFMINTMSTPPEWAEGLPLAAEGGFDTCYSK